jgi:hypothetical protein
MSFSTHIDRNSAIAFSSQLIGLRTVAFHRQWGGSAQVPNVQVFHNHSLIRLTPKDLSQKVFKDTDIKLQI